MNATFFVSSSHKCWGQHPSITCEISTASSAPASDKLAYDLVRWPTMPSGSTQSEIHSGQAPFPFLICSLRFWHTASLRILSRCGTTTCTCFSQILAIAHADNSFEDSSSAMIATPHPTCFERYRRPYRPCVPPGRSQTSDSHFLMTACPPWNRKTTSRPPKHKCSSGKSDYRGRCRC